MTTRILITGFGPFPGAPFNPTELLALELGRRRYPASVHRITHVFHVSYETVDRELPTLIKSERPDALIMFGLATRTAHLRIETRARNVMSRVTADAGGQRPAAAIIDAQAPSLLPLRCPAQRLLLAVQGTGVPAALSHDAGRYLCNYLCWRAAEAARNDGPRLTSFIHVPSIRPAPMRSAGPRPLTFDDLADAGEAIVRAAITAARR